MEAPMSKKCIKLEKCPFFHDKMSEKPATAELYKKRFCLGDNTECARWIVSQTLGPEGTPLDLFPNQKSRAQRLIDSQKKAND
jgi:hypothetical protein